MFIVGNKFYQLETVKRLYGGKFSILWTYIESFTVKQKYRIKTINLGSILMAFLSNDS